MSDYDLEISWRSPAAQLNVTLRRLEYLLILGSFHVKIPAAHITRRAGVLLVFTDSFLSFCCFGGYSTVLSKLSDCRPEWETGKPFFLNEDESSQWLGFITRDSMFDGLNILMWGFVDKPLTLQWLPGRLFCSDHYLSHLFYISTNLRVSVSVFVHVSSESPALVFLF